jgi:RNA polymerase sigma factor (sigma-70 family)
VILGDLTSVLRRLRRVVASRCDGGLSDTQLLERFAAQRDEAAFEVLVWRHGPMVLGVARRLLHNVHDAEDVLQATFLALARQAGVIGQRGTLGGWLYRVAYRTALRVRAQRQKHRAEPLPVDGVPALEPAAGDNWRELLDKELERLPEKYRTPLVLSYLQGLTNREIADQLGCPMGTIFTRLARGRDLLRSRLARRGVALSVGVFGADPGAQAPAASLPPGLVKATVQAALVFAAGTGSVAVAPNVVALTEGVLKMLWLGRLKLVAAVCVLFTLAGSGAGLLAFRAAAVAQEQTQKDAGDEDTKPADPARRPPREALRYGGKSFDDWRTILWTDLKPEVRADAIKALCAFGPNGYGREAAVAVVATMRGYDIDRLDGDDQKVANAAREGLAYKIGAEAAPVLAEELRKGKRNGRLFALAAMEEIGTEASAALPQVLQAIKEKDPAIRHHAILAARALDREGLSVPTLIDALASEDSNDRYAVIQDLARLGAKSKAAAPQLMAIAAKDANPTIRTLALGALVEIKADPKTILPTLKEALKDENQNPRLEAVHRLGQLGPSAKDAVPELTVALKAARNRGEQKWIAQALGNIGPGAKPAIPALTELLGSGAGREVELRNTIVKALEQINK